MERYQHRQEAGQILSQALYAYANCQHALILALPRGGVPVAYEIAKTLHLPLDVCISRKLGVPEHEELAFGALSIGHTKVLNHDIIRELQLSDATIQIVCEKEQAEIQRRTRLYRGHREFPPIKDQIVILVDDGMATGATMHAAILALCQLKPKKIVVAVPVSDSDTYEKIRVLVEDVICPLIPKNLQAVGHWYEDFSQTTDEEVRLLLADSKKSFDDTHC